MNKAHVYTKQTIFPKLPTYYYNHLTPELTEHIQTVNIKYLRHKDEINYIKHPNESKTEKKMQTNKKYNPKNKHKETENNKLTMHTYSTNMVPKNKNVMEFKQSRAKKTETDNNSKTKTKYNPNKKAKKMQMKSITTTTQKSTTH